MAIRPGWARPGSIQPESIEPSSEGDEPSPSPSLALGLGFEFDVADEGLTFAVSGELFDVQVFAESREIVIRA